MSKYIMEYPHCKDCDEYDFCVRNGFTIYKPKFLKFAQKCSPYDCPYDFNCTHECPDYRALCEEDLIVARTMSDLACYEEPLPNIFKSLYKEIKGFVKQTINLGKNYIEEINKWQKK